MNFSIFEEQREEVDADLFQQPLLEVRPTLGGDYIDDNDLGALYSSSSTAHSYWDHNSSILDSPTASDSPSTSLPPASPSFELKFEKDSQTCPSLSLFDFEQQCHEFRQLQHAQQHAFLVVPTRVSSPLPPPPSPLPSTSPNTNITLCSSPDACLSSTSPAGTPACKRGRRPRKATALQSSRSSTQSPSSSTLGKEKKVYYCSVPGCTFAGTVRKPDFYKHEQSHLRTLKYACRHCNKTFHCCSISLVHERDMHRPKGCELICNFCADPSSKSSHGVPLRFKSLHRFGGHLRRFHPEAGLDIQEKVLAYAKTTNPMSVETHRWVTIRRRLEKST